MTSGAPLALSGAVDMALLDIIGRASNAPVYRVLGGPTRNKVRALTTASLSRRFGHVDATSPLALVINIKEMATFDCQFRPVSSSSSFGLQLLDVALWLTKRFLDKPVAIHGKCRELAEVIMTNGHISEFTQQAMFREVNRGLIELESAPFSADQEAKGSKLVGEVEAQRLERMRSGPCAVALL